MIFIPMNFQLFIGFYLLNVAPHLRLVYFHFVFIIRIIIFCVNICF